MLELECIFCGDKTLVMRHVDTRIYQVCCVSCGMRGPYGEHPVVARAKYLKPKEEKNSIDQLGEIS